MAVTIIEQSEKWKESGGNDNEADWYQTLQEIKMFMDNNSRRPRTSQPQKQNKTETELGRWVCNQIANFSEDRTN